MAVSTRIRMAATFGASAILILLVPSNVTHTKALQQQPRHPASSSNATHTPHGKLVFMLTTGHEDILEVRLCLENMKTARTSGYLEDVTWVAEGRGIEVFGRVQQSSWPPDLVQMAREIKTSGVHIIVSSSSLKEYKISTASIDPKPDELVPDPAVRMAELVSQGYQVIRY
jgi:uncharacterized protein